MYDSFTELLNTPTKMRVAQRLAEIEAQDRDACAHCGGEDCICCSIYLDRQKWQEPEEFFTSDIWLDDDNYEPRVDWVYGEEEWLELPITELCPNGYTGWDDLHDSIIAWIRNDIKESEANFEFEYRVKNNIVKVTDIFYIYD